MIQCGRGLGGTRIRQEPDYDSPQYKPSYKQNMGSALPVHADWTAKETAWTPLSTQNRKMGVLSMQNTDLRPTTIEWVAPVGQVRGQSIGQESFYHHRDGGCMMCRESFTKRIKDEF